MKNITSIESLKASLPNTPICLHGTDGLPDSLFQSCIAAGVSKVNVNSWARDQLQFLPTDAEFLTGSVLDVRLSSIEFYLSTNRM